MSAKKTGPDRIILERLRAKINRANAALYEAEMMIKLNPQIPLGLDRRCDETRAVVVGFLHLFDLKAKDLLTINQGKQHG